MRTAAKTAFLLAILTLGSKLLGFIREMFVANFYGASYVVDAYSIASSIPGIIFAGILGAISTSFVPLFSKKMEQEGELAADKFTAQTLNLLTIVSVISSIVGIVFSDQIVWIFAHGFVERPETFAIASYFVKVTFSFTLFTATAGIFDAYLKYKNVFLSTTIAGYSVSICAVIFVFISHYTSPYYLIFGIFVGNVVRFFIILFIARHKGYRHKWDFHITDTVKEIFYLAVPVFIGSTAGQINAFVNRNLAATLPEGSVAAISYSDLLIGLITGVTTMVVATVLFPKLAQAFSQKDMPRFSGIYNTGVSILLIIGIPLSIGAMLYGKDIIQIIYERGAFDPHATTLTTGAFFCYSMGLVFMALNPFLIQTFYSMHNTKTPRNYGLIVIAVNLASNLILVNYLAHAGLALGSSIASLVNTVLLLYAIRRKTDIILMAGTWKKNFKILLSAVIAIGVSYLFYYFVGGTVWMPRMVLMGLVIIIAALIYLLLLKLFKIEELVHFREIFRISQ